MTRTGDCKSLDELYGFTDAGFTDADIPAFRRWFLDMRRRGNPLQLPPSVAAAAKLKGFEEGVHFDTVQPIPIFKPIFKKARMKQARMGVHG